MKSLFIILSFLVVVLTVNAQEEKKESQAKFSVSPAFELLRSTHGNLFYSPSIKANFLFNNGLEPGFGIERSTTPIHHDNGYVLYKLRYLPIYGNLKYNFNTTKKFRAYVESSIGYSFIKYAIANERTPNNTSVTKEGGLYIYGGTGLKYAITDNVKTFIGVGFKAYRITTNDLDINPHGLSFQAGLAFYSLC